MQSLRQRKAIFFITLVSTLLELSGNLTMPNQAATTHKTVSRHDEQTKLCNWLEFDTCRPSGAFLDNVFHADRVSKAPDSRHLVSVKQK